MTYKTKNTEWKWLNLPWNYHIRMTQVHALKREGWVFVKTKKWGGGNQLFRRERKFGGFANADIQAGFEEWKNRKAKKDRLLEEVDRSFCNVITDARIRERCKRG